MWERQRLRLIYKSINIIIGDLSKYVENVLRATLSHKQSNTKSQVAGLLKLEIYKSD